VESAVRTTLDVGNIEAPMIEGVARETVGCGMTTVTFAIVLTRYTEEPITIIIRTRGEHFLSL
jgi:hypothetical protein